MICGPLIALSSFCLFVGISLVLVHRDYQGVCLSRTGAWTFNGACMGGGRDKVCVHVCVGEGLRGVYSYRMILWNAKHKTHMNHTLTVHRHRAR